MEYGWIAFIFSVLTKLIPTRGILLNECIASGWIQVEEGSQNIPLLTCSGLEPNDSVAWYQHGKPLGSCQAGSGKCVTVTTLFNVERPVNEYSKLYLVIPATQVILDAKNISCRVSDKEETCRIDFIIRAKEIACNANFKPGTWNVTTSCNISNFYSTQRNYTCVWKEWISNTSTLIESTFVNWEMKVSSSNSSYNRATCEMNKPLPDKDGVYNYTMTFSPVSEDVDANFSTSNTIYKPKYRPNMNCTNSSYVVEGKDLVCTCDVSDLGQPPGRLLLHWNNSVIYGNYSVRSVLLRFDRVTRQLNGNILRCALDWATMYTGESNVSYTFNVAYGPDSVSILGPEYFEVYPYLTRQLSLICVHSDAKPYVTYHWSGICTNQINNHCNFTPTVANDGQTVICTVFNSLAGVTKNSSFQLTLQYPPPNPPNITGYLGEPLYSDQPKTIFCNVSGGKPHVSNVTFNCQGQSYTNNGQGISIQLLPKATYNGKNCTCKSFWKHPDWYDATATVTLLIYYPPQRPTITVKNQSYPFMEGQSGTIYCQLPNGTDRGNPPAELTWQRQERSDVDSELILSLHPLTIGDNGRNIQCFAVNNFTEVKNMAIETNFTIQVYYRPVLSLNESQGTSCLNNSHPWLCVVEDGQRININCFARSNPTPKNIVWQMFRPYLPDIGQGGNLLIESANHSIHTGIYVCNVTTEDLGGNDSRLPLSSTEELHIIVKYISDNINMPVNSIPENISVKENDVLIFECRANGRPTPKLLLFKGNNLQQPIFEVRGGILNVSVEESVLSYNMPSARCDNTAIYICTASNDDGASAISAMVQVFVMCVPRFIPGSLQANEITFRGEPVFATFELIAYPKVTHIDISKLGYSTVNVYPVESIFTSTCDVSFIDFKTVCRILLNNATTRDAGIYQLTFINAIGQLNFTLQLHVKENSHLGGGHDIGAAAGAGISLAVVAVLVTLVMVILWRNGWILPCSDSNKKPHGNPERSDSSPFSNTDERMGIDVKTTIVSEAEAYTSSTYVSLKVEDIAVASEYDTLKQRSKDTNYTSQLLEQHSSSVRSVEGRNNIEKSTTEADLRSNYESLNKPDVGITLPYEDLGQCNSSEKHDSEAPDTQPAYEELRMQEVGVASQYEHLNKQTTNPESIVEDGHIYSNSSST